MKKRLLMLATSFLLCMGLFAAGTDLYIRGDNFGNWSASDEWKAVSDDGINYVWQWEDPVTFNGKFKFADASADWSGVNLGTLNLEMSDSGICYGTLKQGSENSDIEGNGVQVKSIQLNSQTLQVTFFGASVTLPDMYIRGSMMGTDWPALDEYKGEVSGDVIVWDWSADPKTFEGDFKIADASWSSGWVFGMPHVGVSEAQVEIALDESGVTNVSLERSNDSKDARLPKSLTVSKIEFNHIARLLTITEAEQEEPQPVLLTAEDITVLWGEPVYNPDTKELQLSCTFDIAETQTSVSIDDLLAANPVCFIRFGASGDVQASREGNAVSVTIPNVEAGAELAYSLNMDIGADNAAVISATRIEISNSEWLYSPGTTTEPEPVPDISALYMIGNATTVGWTLTDALAMTKDADNPNVFTWTGDLTETQTEGFKIMFSNEDEVWLPCYVASSPDEVVILDSPITLVYRTEENQWNEETNPDGVQDFKFRVSETGNYTITVTVGQDYSATMTVTQSSVAPVAKWYIAGDGTAENNWCCGKTWDPAGCALSDNGDGTYSYNTTVQAGTYNFKITNGNWYRNPTETPDAINYGHTNINVTASTTGYKDGGDNNVQFTLVEEAEITIVLDENAADNAKITLTSSVEFGYPEITMWTVTGDAILCGTDWDPTDESNDMAEGSETPGVWAKVYESFEVTAENAGTEISFKAVANHNYSIGEYPQGEGNNASITLPAEPGTYNITITLNTNVWSISNSIEKVGGEDPEPAVELYFRGDIVGCGWYDGMTTAEEAGIDPKWKGATADGKIYTWDWSAEPITISDGNQFKIGSFVAGDWASQAYGIAGGAVFAVGEAFAVEIPGGNIAVSGEYAIASATLDTEAGTLLLVEAGAEEPEVETLYIRGSFNNYLQDAIDPESKWAAVPDENGNYIWDWTSLTDEERTIIGEFKIANEDYSIKYGAQQDDQMQIPADLVLGQATGVFDSEKNFNLPQNTKVSKITLNTTDYTLTVEGEVVVEPMTDPLMLYGGVFGTDASVETYLVNSVDGVYTWNFGEGMDVTGWFLIVGRMQGEDGAYTQDWNTKVGSSEQLSLAGGLETATIKVQRGGSADNITINGVLSLTSIIFDSNANELTVIGTEVQEGGVPMLYLRGDFNEWLNDATPGDEAIAQWLGVTSDEGNTYVWDWTSLSEVDRTIKGFFKIGDLFWGTQYGPTDLNVPVEVGTAISFKLNSSNDAIIADPGIIVSRIILDTQESTLLIEGKAVKEPEDPTAELFIVSGLSQSYDSESQTVSLSWTASLIEGVSASDFVGAEFQVFANVGGAGEIHIAPNTGLVDGEVIISRTISSVAEGTEISYRLVFACQGNENYNAVGINLQSGSFKASSDEPEPVAQWYIAGNGTEDNNWCDGEYWVADGCALTDNGNGTFSYSTTVPAGTYEFKVTDGRWNNEQNPGAINYGYSDIDANNSTEGYEPGSGNNAKFTVSEQAEISITLDVNAATGSNIVLKSSVPFGEVIITSWTIVGPSAIFGTDWDTKNTSNDMEQVGDNEWTLTKNNVDYVPTGSNIMFKAVANHDYAIGEFPEGENNNAEMEEPKEAGKYNFTFVLDTDKWTLKGSYEKLTPVAVDETVESSVYVSNGRIYCDNDFVILNLAGQDVTCSNGNLQGTYIVLVGDQAVKVLVD